MRYFLYLILATIFKITAKFLSPVLPLFARNQYGYGATKYIMIVEPRLPIWLDWFMMDDYSLWGGEEWRTRLHPHNYKTYLGMALWLLRNSACNFLRYPLAVTQNDSKAWQLRKIFFITNKYSIHTNIGWNLDSPSRISSLCNYVSSIKIVKDKNVSS